MSGSRLQVSDILDQAGRIVSASRIETALYVGGVSGVSIFVDLTSPDSPGGNFSVNLVLMAAGYLLLRAMVKNAGLGDGQRGFGAYFGLSLLSGLGILAGAIFLVIPGLILAVRWQPAFGILMAERDAGVSDSLSQSWDLTRGHFWPIFAGVLLGVAIILTAGLVYAGSELSPGISSEFSIVAGNVLLSCGSVYFSGLCLATYSLLRPRVHELDEVFA